MAATYEDAPHEVYRLLDGLLQEHRKDLVAADVNIKLLFAWGKLSKSGFRTAPMKSRGKRILGKCKVHSLADRQAGTEDVTITLDGERWGQMSEKRQKALLHHEVLHIDAWGAEIDSDDRPKLKARHGDWDFDGFHDVLTLYGEESVEYANLKRVSEKNRQLAFSWAAADAVAPAEEVVSVEFGAAAGPVATEAKKRRKARASEGEQIAARSRR